jgi:hypothetical protein
MVPVFLHATPLESTPVTTTPLPARKFSPAGATESPSEKLICSETYSLPVARHGGAPRLRSQIRHRPYRNLCGSRVSHLRWRHVGEDPMPRVHSAPDAMAVIAGYDDWVALLIESADNADVPRTATTTEHSDRSDMR